MTDLFLPNGKIFEMWKDTTAYKHIYHVSQKHPNADDNNDGSPEAPFLTVSKAAAIARAGDCVMIHEGVYRECIHPEGSGKSPDNMLCFSGAPDENVIITGGEILDCHFSPSTGWKKTNWNSSRPYEEGFDFANPGAKVYMFKFPRNSFIDTNPFGMINGNHYAWYLNDTVPAKMFYAKTIDQKRTTVLRRGMIYCDGKRLEQVSYYYQLGSIPGSFWVEDDGLTIHIRMFDDSDPRTHVIEYTAREQCFSPEKTGSSYIKLENLSFKMCGNGFPPPQRGMVSAYCGHHYMVKNCTFSDANGIGMDLGFQCPARFENLPKGGHIVTGCTFKNCGINGLAASVCSSDEHYLEHRHGNFFILDNYFIDNCWQNFDQIMEEAALKLHHLVDSIICRNYIKGCPNGCAIWLDASNENIALRDNIIINTRSRDVGSLFIEASHDDIEISHNIVIDAKAHDGYGGSGIYSHNCDNIKNKRNIVLNCENFGIEHKYGETGRINCGSGNTGFGIDFIENIISNCRHAVMQPTERGNAEGNIYGYFPNGGYLKVGSPPLHLDLFNWRRYMGWDKNGGMADIKYQLKENGLDLSIKYNDKKTDFFISFDKAIGFQIDELLDSLNN